jgi:hypothetical protein
VGFAATGKMYLNFWQYYDAVGTADGTSTSYQIKFIEVAPYWTPGQATPTPQYVLSHWQYGSPPKDGWYNKTYQANYLEGGGSSPNLVFPTDAFKTPGWYHISVQTNFGTMGTANGSTKMWVSKPGLSGVYASVSANNVKYIAGSGYPDYIKLGWYAGSYYPTSTNTFTTTLYYDSIYIDNSWARVEIGDADTYDNCTHREIQIPDTWETGHISLKVNPGSFNLNDSVYLYVIDESGAVNPKGYSIKIGGRYPIIAAPQNLQGQKTQ